MTYNPNVPNASQSPGLFPTQNNTNFARLKTIINADHLFNDTAQSTDGVHRQCTMIARAIPGALIPGTNSILYTWIDANNQAQLRFYNGDIDYQLTPNLTTSPTKLTGSVSLTGGQTSGNIFNIPANTFGTIFVNYVSPTASNQWRYLGFYRSGSSLVDAFIIKESNNTGRPNISISGANLRVVNGENSTKTVGYYIIWESI